MENYDWQSITGIIENNEFNPEINICTLKDELLFTDVNEASDALYRGNTGFITYDLQLSEAEIFHIAQTTINNTKKTGATYFNTAISNASEEVGRFMNFLMPDEMHTTKSVMKNLFLKLINSVIFASGYEFAEIDIRLSSESTEPFMDLHIDKSQEEIIAHCNKNSKNQAFENRKIFIFPLYGEPTYFFNMSEETKNEFLTYTYETRTTYGQAFSDYQDEILLLYDKMNFSSPAVGQASIHYAGTYGTVHSRPFTHGKRLTMLITPNEKDLLSNFNSCLEYLLQTQPI